MKQAIFSLSLAALGTGFFFHISDCKSKYLTRAEFDEYVADRARTDIGDAKPLHGHGDAKRVCASANGDKEADARPVATQPAEVAHKRVDEMCGRNGRANGDKD